MVFRGSRLNLIHLFVATALMGLFQNCGPAMKGSEIESPASPKPPAGENVLGATADFSKITFDPALEVPTSVNVASLRLELDLETGVATLLDRATNASLTCPIEPARLSILRDLMASAEICEPAPPPPGTATCLAIGIADIQLANENRSIQLRPVICGSGVYLCGEADARLRTLLQGLRDTSCAR